MAFLQKTWKDRVAEYINRRVLTKEDGTTEQVSVERSEGTISQEGDAFSAANMNDLEQRIANEFSEQNKNITALGESVSSGKTLVANAITAKGVSTSTSDTFSTMATNIGKISTTPKSCTKVYYSSSTDTNTYTYTFPDNSYYHICASGRYDQYSFSSITISTTCSKVVASSTTSGVAAWIVKGEKNKTVSITIGVGGVSNRQCDITRINLS